MGVRRNPVERTFCDGVGIEEDLLVAFILLYQCPRLLFPGQSGKTGNDIVFETETVWWSASVFPPPAQVLVGSYGIQRIACPSADIIHVQAHTPGAK